MSQDIPCALCGTTSTYRIVGRTGCVCSDCLGEAAKQLLAKSNAPSVPNITASDRCLLCGEAITIGDIVAVRHPYCICHACILTAVENAVPLGTTDFIQVNF